MKTRSAATSKVLVMIGLVWAAGFGSGGMAQTTTPQPVTIDKLGTVWDADGFILRPPAGHTFSNPANCSLLDGYIAAGAWAGYKGHLQMAQMALALNKPVVLVISATDCVYNRPRIMAVEVPK